MMGQAISDEQFKLILLMSLPESWDGFTTSFLGTQGAAREKTISSQQLITIIVNEYEHLKVQKGAHANNSSVHHEDQTYVITGGNWNKRHRLSGGCKVLQKCSICRLENHTMENCHWKGKPKCGYCN